MRSRSLSAYIIENFLILLLISVLVPSNLSTYTPSLNSLYFDSPKVTGDSLRMFCDYEVDNETLESVKWYRNRTEFFRYQPDSSPSYTFFPNDGIDVDISMSDDKSIYLRNISLETSGYYYCQITVNRTYFRTESFQRVLHVVDNLTDLSRIERLGVPSTVKIGDNARLHCEYELGTETIAAVKWFWNNFVFFSYEPYLVPPFMSLPRSGLDVDVSKSNNQSVYLRNVSLESSGNYTCQISTDIPFLRTVQATKELQVLVPPTEGPFLIDEKPNYKLGKNVSITCISGKAKPSPKLKWYINDQLVISDLADEEITVYPNRLESSNHTLNLLLTPEVLEDGKVNLKCVSTFNQTHTEIKTEITPSA